MASARRGLEILKDMQQVGVALDPTERLILELPPGKGDPPYGDRITGRAIDLIAPIGRGQRCLIVSPPKAGKTRILQCIAASVAFNHPDVEIYALLVDERPEEVTDFKRNTPANVIAASSDMSIEEHIETAEYAMEVVAQQVIEGKDVVLLLDSITRLARAYNNNADGSGRTMSGGLDTNAMQAPRQIFGAARKIEGGGSLTILGTALIDTGSRMDQVIFEEFKGTGNSEIYLSRELAERRIYPAIDIAKSGTRKEEKLYPPDIVPRIHMLRRGLAGLHPQEAMTQAAGAAEPLEDERGDLRALKGVSRAGRGQTPPTSPFRPPGRGFRAPNSGSILHVHEMCGSPFHDFRTNPARIPSSSGYRETVFGDTWVRPPSL